MPGTDVSVKLLENHWVNIRAGRSNTKMVGMTRANFPGLPTFPAAGAVKIPAQTLRSMCQGTASAVPKAAVKSRALAPALPHRKPSYECLVPETDVSVKLLENHWVNIRAGRSNTKMVGMTRANFPGLPTFPAAGAMKIPAQTLRSMVSGHGFSRAESCCQIAGFSPCGTSVSSAVGFMR